MYKVSLSDTEGRKYPDNKKDEGFLDDYENTHIANLASAFGINAIIGDDHFRLGNSGTSIKISFTGAQDAEGRREFEKYVSDLIGIIKEALPSMSGKYKSFYDHFVKDYEENGLCMPMWD